MREEEEDGGGEVEAAVNRDVGRLGLEGIIMGTALPRNRKK